MMIQKARSSLVAVVAAAAIAASAGCFGRFRVTMAVYEFNAGIGNKFLRSLAMWAMIIIPVYEIAGLADILIFNTIEFWGGGSVAKIHKTPDGGQVEVAQVSPEVLRVRWMDAAGRGDEIEVVKVSARAGYLRRPGGAIVGTLEQTEDGRIVARPAQGQSVPPAVLAAASK